MERKKRRYSVNSCLIGYSGFIGGNLLDLAEFKDVYNSHNIDEIRGKGYDLVVSAGLPGVKWRAEMRPEEDMEAVLKLMSCLKQVRAERVVVISTVDVYRDPVGVDENVVPGGFIPSAYGMHRLAFERFLSRVFWRASVIRLPLVFGPGMRKNVVYDLMNGHRVEYINPHGRFQYYDVRRLWKDILRVVELDLETVNLVSAPVHTGRLVELLFPAAKVGKIASRAARYDVRSVHGVLFGGKGGYLATEEEILREIGDFAGSEIVRPSRGARALAGLAS